MAGITTHVLDTVGGTPGEGMKMEFSIMKNGKYELQRTLTTNSDGRIKGMILTPPQTKIGDYEIKFYVGDYYRSKGVKLPDPAFIDIVPVRFSIFDIKQHYHVPMLCTPWSCTTYRGS